MKFKILLGVLVVGALTAFVMSNRCYIAKPVKAVSPVLAKINAYEISADEFEQGFATSAFSPRADKLQARREYLDTLVNQKLILLDAQKKNIDKDPDFLRSVERFWAQSLLTITLGQKTLELHKGARVREEDIRRIYENMIKDGVTDKPFEVVYPQIKWQAEKQLEAQLLDQWMKSLREEAVVSINENVLKSLK